MLDQLQVRSPFDGEVLADLAYHTPEQVEDAIAMAFRLATQRSQWLPKPDRLRILKTLQSLLHDQSESLAQLIAQEGGKPIRDARVEAMRAADTVGEAARYLASYDGQKIPMGLNAASAHRTSWTTPEPAGVVLGIGAFNHPLNLIAHLVAPAIAAGCPILIKPALKTPLSCLKFVELAYQAGLPPRWCQPLIVPDTITAEMAADNRLAVVGFIGSAEVGWKLRSRLAPGVRCLLEHGGAAPVIVCSDTDLDLAIPSLVKGGYYHAGQVCVSVQRVYVHDSILDTFCNRFTAAVKALHVGDPMLETTDIGPIIRPQPLQRITEWIAEAQKTGAKLLCGGHVTQQTCYEPTVLLNPSPQAKVSTDEVFGPLVCVYGYSQLEQAVARANSLPFVFQAAVFTQNLDTAVRVSHQLNATAVMINDHTAFRVDWMPFGGAKQSGLGTGGVAYFAHEMSTEKLVVLHTPAN
ncbi:MAG: aldehyde dehydrogenase family protein [Candidatus Margulisiibacteriota bacterium]